MIRMTSNRVRRVVGVASLTASLVISMGAAASFAEAPVQELVDVRTFEDNPYLNYPANNPGCAWFYGTDDEAPFTTLTKFDPANGETGDVLEQDGITVTITDHKGNDESLVFDWDSGAIDVVMVIVKSSSGANLYVYPDGATSGTDLVTVGDHGISHITFCAGTVDDDDDDDDDGGDEPNPTIAPAASAAGSCEAGVTVSLDNSGTDDDVDETTHTTTYTVVVTVNGTEVHNASHNVDEGQSEQVGPFALGDTDSESWSVIVSSADLEDDIVASGTEDCADGGAGGGGVIIVVTSAEPAAAFNHVCTTGDAGVATLTLSNTGDAAADFTVVTDNAGSSNAQKVTVAPGDTEVQSVPMSGSEVLNFLVTSGESEWAYAADNDKCVTVVQALILENQPTPEVAAEQLAATGLESPDLLLLAMLFGALGLALLLATKPDPLAVRTQ